MELPNPPFRIVRVYLHGVLHTLRHPFLRVKFIFESSMSSFLSAGPTMSLYLHF